LVGIVGQDLYGQSVTAGVKRIAYRSCGEKALQLGFPEWRIRAILRRFQIITFREAIMRWVLVVTLGGVLMGMAEVSAEGPAPLRPAQRQAAIEAKLDQPLQWDWADRKHATLAELLAFVQEKHGLKIRWDARSLALLHGEQAPFARAFPTSPAQPAYSSSPYGSNSNASSPPLAPTYPSLPQPTGPETTRAPKPPVSPDPYQWPPLAPNDVAPNDAAPSPAASPQTAVAPPSVLPATKPGNAAVSGVAGPDAESAKASGVAEQIAFCMAAPIAVSAVSLKEATVREGLQQFLDALPLSEAAALQVGIPITTRALNLTLLADENSVLITTQLRANAAKETRVYQLDALGDMPPETLVRVITHSVRPWSWRGQVHEIADELASRWPKTPLPLPTFEFNVSEGVKLASSESAGQTEPASPIPIASEETVAATGQLLAGSAVAAVDSIVAALEIIHHGDPPTGVIEVLPGMLVITQSQAAHREIEELLHALQKGN
jgi:hypothetical protein